ncbi:MAG TPA: DNA primase [Bdellovibrionota bacterium]|jgi:DNA primase
MYSEEFIAKVKASVDIVDVVGESVQLRRSGKYLTGLSPFTKEKTPSFFVNPETQSFKCFSSDQGGDVFTFLRLTKGLNFPEAVAALAEKIGMALEETNKSPEQIERERKLSEERKAALKLNRFAARFYQEQFEGEAGAAARDYAKKRGILPESILGFALGFAPDSWTALRDYFLKIKAPMVQSYELGLFRTKGNEKPKADGSNLFDTFRNRLVFPIRDPQGEVLGFGGRWLGPASAEAPKYLNSPESAVYEKDKILYNLDQARKPIRDLETAVLVEGYMDCLALVQAGFTNVVANCGTALTRTQVGILRKLAPRVICLYDSDKAGQAAMEKAMNLFLEVEGVPLLGARLPDGKDPDEFLREHGEEGRLRMAEILQNSPALLDDWLEKTVQEGSSTLQGRMDTLNKIAPKLAKLRDDLAIQARLPGLAKSLELEGDLLIEAVRKFKKTFLAHRATGSQSNSSSAGTYANAKTLPPSAAFKLQKSRQIQGASGTKGIGFQRRFLRDLLRNPTWLESLRKLDPQNCMAVLAPIDDAGIQQTLGKVLEPLAPEETEGQRVGSLLNVFRDQPDIRNLLAEVSMEAEDELPAKDLESALRRLKEESLKKRAFELQERIHQAEAKGDMQTSEALLLELTELRRQRAQN